MTDTPRTDAAACDGKTVPADFAADLERELAAMTARAEAAEQAVVSLNACYDSAANRADKAEAERDEARAEALEQARLNGMGSEREARLMAQVQELQRELLALRAANYETQSLLNGAEAELARLKRPNLFWVAGGEGAACEELGEMAERIAEDFFGDDRECTETIDCARTLPSVQMRVWIDGAGDVDFECPLPDVKETK